MPTAPTLVLAQFDTNTSGSSITSSSISWQTDDVVVMIFGNSAAAGSTNNAVPTNTGSGLSWTRNQSHDAGSNCAAVVATAVATATSSGTVTFGTNAGNDNHFIGLYVWRNSTGVGNSAITATPSSTRTVSLTPTGADGAICWGVFDWNADAAVAETPTSTSHSSGSPGPSATPQKTNVAGQYTYYWCELDDQTSTGAVSYGIGGSGAGPFTIVAVEVKAGAGGADTTAPSVPTGLHTTAVGSTTADLAWTGSTDDTAVTGYEILIVGP